MEIELSRFLGCCERVGKRLSLPLYRVVEALTTTQPLTLFYTLPENYSSLPLNRVDKTTEYHSIGRRPAMEDSSFYFSDRGIRMMAVFDGHGGAEASRIASQSIPLSILQGLGRVNILEPLSVQRLIRRVVEEFEREKWIGSGSTMTMYLGILNTHYLINIGDSRTIIFDKNGEIVASTVDHSITNVKEIERIQKSGGFVVGGRLMGILSVFRALGDRNIDGDKKILIADPDIQMFRLNPSQSYHIMVGCDGIFEKMSSSQVVGHLLKKMDAYSLVQAAYNSGSRDNLSAIVTTIPGMLCM